MVGRTCCLPFWNALRTYFFKFLLDRSSDFYETRTISPSDHAKRNLLNSSWLVKPFSNNVQANLTSILEHSEKVMRLGVSHSHNDLRGPAQFQSSTTTYRSQDGKKNFFLLINFFFFCFSYRLSDFHQNQLRSSSVHANNKLWILCQSWTVNHALMLV